ncbi:MAG: phosphate ABC transporter permease PstA [Candidatus Krumholzibacteriia bacterium]
MRIRSLQGRRFYDRCVKSVSVLSALVAITFLAWILFVILQRGFGAFNAAFFTELPTPPGVGGGGVANAIAGTLLMTALATAAGVPLGAASGIFLAEFGKGSRLAAAARFAANVLMGTPSIIIGVFVYTITVLRAGHFSGYAGAIALAAIMLPIVARTTEDMLHLVPDTLRESALALGAPYWKMILHVVFRAARAGLLTGVILAVARVSGETAPLLFTALNNPNWGSLNEPMGNLTVTIFNFAMSPYDNWQTMAWGASLLITAGVLLTTVTARLLVRGQRGRAR